MHIKIALILLLISVWNWKKVGLILNSDSFSSNKLSNILSIYSSKFYCNYQF